MPSRSVSGPLAPDLIALGAIRKAHGVRGEASVEPWTDSVERFDELGRVFLVSPDETRWIETSVASARPHAGRVLVAFDGIDTPEEIRDLQDWTIEIPKDESRPLEEGEYFLHDLVGLSVLDDESGRILGRVTATSEGGGGILLTIEPGRGKPFEIPFAAEICRTIDVGGGTLRVDLPAGLEDLESVVAVEDEPEELPAGQPSLPFRIDVVTIFPGMFAPLLSEGILARAVKNSILDLRVWDLRDFTSDRHRSTDDEAYGGGHGMVMLAEPVFRCVDAIRATAGPVPRPRVVMMSPQGRVFGQAVAAELRERGWLVILCGRYEGFDERIRQAVVDEELSVGDFVVAGGEIPAMLVTEAVARLVEGVVGDRNSVEADSFYNGLLDHPHYTRPAEFRGMKVPDVLLSGHAENIRKWRKEQSLRATLEKRPELLESAELDDEARAMLRKMREEGTG